MIFELRAELKSCGQLARLTFAHIFFPRPRADEFAGFDHERGEADAVDATRVQPDRMGRAAGLSCRPVPEKNRLWTSIDVVPGNAAAFRRIGAHGANLSHIAGHLLIKWDTRPHSRMHYQVRSEID